MPSSHRLQITSISAFALQLRSIRPCKDHKVEWNAWQGFTGPRGRKRGGMCQEKTTTTAEELAFEMKSEGRHLVKCGTLIADPLAARCDANTMRRGFFPQYCFRLDHATNTFVVIHFSYCSSAASHCMKGLFREEPIVNVMDIPRFTVDWRGQASESSRPNFVQQQKALEEADGKLPYLNPHQPRHTMPRHSMGGSHRSPRSPSPRASPTHSRDGANSPDRSMSSVPLTTTQGKPNPMFALKEALRQTGDKHPKVCIGTFLISMRRSGCHRTTKREAATHTIATRVAIAFRFS